MRRRLPTVARVLRVVSQWLAPSLVSHVRQLPTSAIRTGQEAAQEFVDATPDQEEIPFDVSAPVQETGEVAPSDVEEATRQSRIEEEDEQGRPEPVRPGEVEGEEGVTPARRVTPQVAAIPGMTPLGVTPAAPVEVEDDFSTPAGGAFIPLCDDDCLQGVLDIFSVGLISIDKATV